MKALVLYYSRTGNTRRLAEEIADALEADLEALKDNKNRRGPIGFIKSGREARSGKTIDIEPLSHDLRTYHVIIVGTPVWASTMSTPVRTLLREAGLRDTRVAWFCTSGSRSKSMHEGCFNTMNWESGCTPVATLGLAARTLRQDHAQVIEDFASMIRTAGEPAQRV